MITLPSGRKIGTGEKPFIIAEVGSNWRNFEDAKQSVVAAKQSGADAVKFQLFDRKSIYGLSLREYRGAVMSNNTTEEMAGAMPPGWIPKLKEKADATGIEFMCSAFSPELIDVVDPFVNIHKVASAEMLHVGMLKRLREIGKPVILSTGGHTKTSVSLALTWLGAWRDDGAMDGVMLEEAGPFVPDLEAVLLYCVASYPAREIELEIMHEMTNRWPIPVGFSDHSNDVLTIPIQACKMGAVVLEKHFTIIPDIATPDRDHSINPDQFRKMVYRIRRGPPRLFGPTPEEQAMVLRHDRRLIATQDIPKGGVFTEENFGIYRSLKDAPRAFGPFHAHLIHGKLAREAIAAGDGIGPHNVEW